VTHTVSSSSWPPGGRSPLDRLLGGCLMVLLAALALHVAADLILAVWVVLASAAGGLLLVGAAYLWWRDRSGGW
jgi:hypothetical protein